MKWNVEIVIMITIEHFQMNQISALNNTQGVDIAINKRHHT